MRIVIPLVLLAVTSVGCGAAPVPASGTLTQTQSAIRAAEEVGAGRVPKAQLHLKMAKDQVATAQALHNDGEEEEAAVIFARAALDAELALTLAKEANVRAQADEAMKKVQDLKKGE